MLGIVTSELDSGLSPEQKMYAHDDKLLAVSETYEPAIEGRKRIEPAINPKRAVKSPFFSSTTHPTVTGPAVVPGTVTPSPSSAKKKARPPRGAVSSLPIPPLSASRFGLIQEELADDPFRLLVAVTFLIRTAGKVAIPVFYELMGRFPGPAALAAADPAEIISLIRPLGLSAIRCAAIQKYARTWLSRPPIRDKRYSVKNYPLPGDGRHVRAGEEFGPEGTTGAAVGGCPSAGILLPPDEVADAVADARQRALGCAWEIGHLTQGPYTLDSWRIFCRDVLLGRATHWTGKGSADPTFQPEWMRVLPKDKELRAWLRWMWLREGWEWDPLTGERQPLREELREAVDGGRVGYDDHGSLIILDQQLGDLG
ncbi:DNA glycosylase [Lasiosphaeria ovina]|uniref:DNA glycosylase n=1 Tax=Lasiosphaeria ovina TaxID=92902 RepID=A0AAE0JV32_9PEZI|nr:DNA glycosylase [Lasiosphaeria ovina]